jgi:hypothetical protein
VPRRQQERHRPTGLADAPCKDSHKYTLLDAIRNELDQEFGADLTRTVSAYLSLPEAERRLLMRGKGIVAWKVNTAIEAAAYGQPEALIRLTRNPEIEKSIKRRKPYTSPAAEDALCMLTECIRLLMRRWYTPVQQKAWPSAEVLAVMLWEQDHGRAIRFNDPGVERNAGAIEARIKRDGNAKFRIKRM